MNWFWLSLIAILFWSGSDLFSKMGSKPDDPYSHWKMVMMVGGVMGIHAIVMLCLGTPFSLIDTVTYLPASFLYILSMILGYVGLRYIVLSVSSPICNSSGAVSSLLCFLFLKQTMLWFQFVAVALICLGVIFLSVFERREELALRKQSGETVERKYTHSVIAVLFPLLYCLIDGLGTFADTILLDGYIAEESANIAYELTFLAMAIFAFVYVVIIRKQKLTPRREGPKLTAAVCETAGQFAYIFAIGSNSIVAAPMISSYCVFSLLWARLLLKEKLSWQQYAAIAVAAVGIIILGIEL